MAIEIQQLPIKDAYVIIPPRWSDHRGYFNELYNNSTYPLYLFGSISGDWRQVSVSMTDKVNTLRGLHRSPYNKLCTVLSGGIIDVIVDMREDSPTFLKWCSLHLTEENRKQVHIPPFCLHGFVSIRPDTRMLYLQGGTFDSKQESDLNPFDKLLDIYWPPSGEEAYIMSDKDRNAPSMIHASRMPHLAGRSAMPRVLVIGASGQVGAALVREFTAERYLVYGTHNSNPHPDEYTVLFNLEAAAANPVLADELLDMMHPQLVIICAAFTHVDGAEDARDRVHAINVAGPAAVATAALRVGAKLVVYSTDYVWDGKKGPYAEDTPPCAINVYGQSKIDMEEKLIAIDPTALVLRTTVVYGPEKQGKNFIYQLCRNLAAGKKMRVVSDQISSPTYNKDLALVTRLLVQARACGIFNACGEELFSRHAFALVAAEALGLDASLIEPCHTSDMTQKAARPLNAGMRLAKVESVLGGRFKPRTVKEAIADWRSNTGSNDAPLELPRVSRL